MEDSTTDKKNQYGDFWRNKELLYEFDPEKGYVQSVNLHSDSDRFFIEQYWDFSEERADTARRKFLEGKASPILYHMEIRVIELSFLHKIVGLPKWKVKRHLKARVFNKLSQSVLQKYADAFNISIETLKQTDKAF
jgi:hypothetical protein